MGKGREKNSRNRAYTFQGYFWKNGSSMASRISGRGPPWKTAAISERKPFCWISKGISTAVRSALNSAKKSGT